MKNLLKVLLSSACVAGCVTTEVRDYAHVDADQELRATTIIVDGADVGLANSVESRLVETLAAAGVTASAKRAIRDVRTDTVLVVAFGGTGPTSRIIGAQTHGGASAYQYGSGYTASYSATTTPIYSSRRTTYATATLARLSTGEHLWEAQLETKAGGHLFMSDDATGSDLATNIIESLRKHGIVK